MPVGGVQQLHVGHRPSPLRHNEPVAEDAGQDVWWRDAVVYQVYPRSFADGDGDGVGDLAGLASRLDHLAWLGVDVIWLSPVYPSPQDDNGYDISDYQDIDPAFGTLAEFDALLAAIHDRGMRLVMDLVVNHTSDEHPWFTAARSSPDSPYRDWYWWRPPRPGFAAGEPGAEPTNWESVFSGPAWELDEASGEYYLHLFSRKQPDLNWENPQVRAAIHSMMRWWLDRGVDGFRMDVINFISKDPALPDGVVATGARYGDGSPAFLNGPRIHEYLAEIHREVLRRPTAGGAHRRRDAGGHGGGSPAVHRPGPGRGGHGLPVRAHVPRPGRRPSGTCGRLCCRTSRSRSDAGRTAWPRSGGTASTGATTTSRAWSPATATTASTARDRPRRSPPSCTCTGARRTCTRAKRSACATRPSRGSRTSATWSRSTTTPRPWAVARTPTRCSRPCG